MITYKKIYEILSEQDEAKREELLAALPEHELDSLLKDAEKLHAEGERILNRHKQKG